MDKGDFNVEYTPAGSSITYQATVTAAVVNGGDAKQVDITVTYPAGTPAATSGDTFVVTAKTGNDVPTPNTVGDKDTPQQFQAVGDAVQLTES